ncbi:ABC transporter substrate-binding protein [Streptosporangium sp. 'caverna']|uniref:ABC transporter substrate-binding protein n=1 Tax=Streptosporangium sp. 'caverna' TaxID=2202249 RepID=UPI000D7DA4A4|nr:ABC transporter substrate-binding protein [Streptosporangium sp. 'caverna']AWS41579.1 aliphatic sulfonates ABC transporter substrate-binding protein [Streptosporangium sp. 'caverna']
MTLRRLFLALCLFAFCTACGSTPDGAGSGASAASAGGKTLTLGFSAWPGWFPWQVAQERGLFAKNGLKVELKYFDSYTDSLTALATGNIDANSQTLNDTLASVSGGAKQTIVLVNDNSTGNDQIIARPGISTVADLKGMTVAAEQGTVDHYLLLLALQKAGLTEKDITFKPLPTDAAAAAFKAGQVDAVGVFAPFTTTALELSGSKAVATSKDFPGAIPDHLAVDKALVAERPDEVQALVKTWFETLRWIAANRTEANAIMAKRGGVDEAAYASYDAGTTIFSLEDNLAAFEPGTTGANLDHQASLIAKFLVSSGLADTEPSLDGLFEPKFVRSLTP